MNPVAGAGCALLEVDHRGVITSGNGEVARLTGFVPSELAGRHLSVLCDDPARPDGIARGLARAATAGADRLEGWQVRRDGTRFRADWVIVARRAADGGVAGFSVVLQERDRAGAGASAGGRTRAARAARRERGRLAQELHDSVAQLLYGIGLGTRTARRMLEREPWRAREPLDYVLRLAESGLAEIRALIFDLRPHAVAQDGLVAGLSAQLAALRTGRDVVVRPLLGPEPAADPQVKLALFRVGREALHNVARHAHARHVTLRLAEEPDGLVLEVVDDGVGFDPDGRFPGHLGLASMRRRLTEVGGALEIRSAPGRGTRVRARVPRSQGTAGRSGEGAPPGCRRRGTPSRRGDTE
ncbi:MAG: histidine kinase [Micromonosporaceae bacterium]|jgi:PAS domain S-box-containing protein